MVIHIKDLIFCLVQGAYFYLLGIEKKLERPIYKFVVNGNMLHFYFCWKQIGGSFIVTFYCIFTFKI